MSSQKRGWLGWATEIVAVALLFGRWCLVEATSVDYTDAASCRAQIDPVDSAALLQVGSSNLLRVAETFEEEGPPVKVMWTSVLSLDPRCDRQGAMELLEMYTAAVKSFLDHSVDRVFDPFFLTHIPPGVQLQDLHSEIRQVLMHLEGLGVTVMPFTSGFYDLPYREFLRAHAEEKLARKAEEGEEVHVRDVESAWTCQLGTYARFDVPEVIMQSSEFHSGSYNSSHLLYTDLDVLWMDSVTLEDWYSMAPTNGCTVSMGNDIKPELEADPHASLNAGVIVMDIQDFRSLVPQVMADAVDEEFRLKAKDQTLLYRLFQMDPGPPCATTLSGSWNYKPWWGMRSEEAGSGHNVVMKPRLVHLQGLHPSSGLLCTALQAHGHRLGCSDTPVANESTGMMDGAEVLQTIIQEQYEQNGYEMLLNALLYYYHLLGQPLEDVASMYGCPENHLLHTLPVTMDSRSCG
mmetsp:Transcript_17575/g.31715  ORF Transcript_17575/g.31715 Transcript_17575/m.31715 type:complete len:462 (+) Transcript_17575:45-1430(+)